MCSLGVVKEVFLPKDIAVFGDNIRSNTFGLLIYWLF